MSFQAGDKVVCVDDAIHNNEEKEVAHCYSELPTAGRIYVVRDAYASPSSGRPACRLVGIRGSIHPFWGTEMGFVQERFRKLDELKAESRALYYQQHPQRKPQEGVPA